jgi:hypothetical protein
MRISKTTEEFHMKWLNYQNGFSKKKIIIPVPFNLSSQSSKENYDDNTKKDCCHPS